IRLMLLNLGGGIPGVGSSSVFSSPLRYTACLTENMKDSPWGSLAVSRGYSTEDNVITCAMVDPPKYCHDDASREPQRLLTGIVDSMAGIGTWNMLVPRCAVVVAMGPQHAAICAQAGMNRADVQRRFCEMAGRKVRELKRGGNWRDERAQKMNINPEDDDYFVPVIKDPRDLQLIVAGSVGPFTAVCHGWGGGSLAVHDTYKV
ncbi:MAG: hypothetical protein HY525_12465, partial [Betaproteobacteria bacterium]|nr:hypothetical protein [Betaproteobacteria bacterium]